MAGLKSMVKAKSLPITMKHEKWIALPEHKRAFSPEALEHAERVLSGKIGGKRVHKTPYRASGSGGCQRARQFGRMKVDQNLPVDTRLSNIFITGDFLHLKWQMFGITAGWLIGAEIPVMSTDGILSGTMDGEVWDGSGFEFKSINDRGFSNVLSFGPPDKHLLQSHGYMIASGKRAFSFIYENKDDQDYIEIRIEYSEEYAERVLAELEELERQFREKDLREPLSDCLDKKGSTFRNCPYRAMCLGVHEWGDIDGNQDPKGDAA